MGWVVNATPRPLYPRGRPGIHCIGGWVGPRAGLDGCGKSRPHRDSIPGPSVTSRYIDWAIAACTLLERLLEMMDMNTNRTAVNLLEHIGSLFYEKVTTHKISILQGNQKGSWVLRMTCSERYDTPHLSWLFSKMDLSAFWLLERTISWIIR